MRHQIQFFMQGLYFQKTWSAQKAAGETTYPILVKLTFSMSTAQSSLMKIEINTATIFIVMIWSKLFL